MDLIQLVYASAAAAPFTPPQLRALLEVARKNNVPIEVSGLLLYQEGSFLQILEGDDEVVMSLFRKISKDLRHGNVILLAKNAITERAFGEWTMGFVDVASLSAGSPGFVDLLNATASFLDLQRNHTLVGRIVDGFHEGRWRQHIT